MVDAIESYLVDVPDVFVQEVFGLVLPGPYMVEVGGLVRDESGGESYPPHSLASAAMFEVGAARAATLDF